MEALCSWEKYFSALPTPSHIQKQQEGFPSSLASFSPEWTGPLPQLLLHHVLCSSRHLDKPFQLQYTNINRKAELDAALPTQPSQYWTGRNCHFPQHGGRTLANAAVQAFAAVRVFCWLVFSLSSTRTVIFFTHKKKNKEEKQQSEGWWGEVNVLPPWRGCLAVHQKIRVHLTMASL